MWILGKICRKIHLWLTFPHHLCFLRFFFLPLEDQRKKTPIANPWGEAEDTVSCKTYALNIRAIKLVKLKAILENRKRNIYASGSG